MRIAFKFHYIHNNALFDRLLQEISGNSSLPLETYKENENYIIGASGEQSELEELAELISTVVPQSLFLRGYTLEELKVPNEPQPLSVKKTYFSLPCCPKCEQKIALTLDPFEQCNICGFSNQKLCMEDLLLSAQIDLHGGDEVFSELAERLIAEGVLVLPTFNGIRRFSLLGKEDEKGILVCNPSNISSSWVITQGELDALMLIEKPSVRLKPKLKFRAEYDLTKSFYTVFFADDKITLALSTALSRKGVEAICCDQPPLLRVASVLGHHVIIHIGRDMLPWHHQMALKQNSCCLFENFYASWTENGISVDTDVEPDLRACVWFTAKGEASIHIPSISFEPAHAVLRSIVLEHGLEGKSLCGVYLSRSHHSQICSFSPKIGYAPMAYFLEESMSSPKAMLASIAQMDEAGARLAENFKKAYTDEYEHLEQISFDGEENASMISKLWAMAALFLGLYKGGDVVEGCERLEAAALEFIGNSGPRIDYKMVKTDNGYQLDPRSAIRSAMSFKLAGVNEFLLSYGFIDSLADFISQQAELADANIAINGVALSGSLFENRQLLKCTYNALSANYKIYRNECLSIDGANVAVGAVALGRE